MASLIDLPSLDEELPALDDFELPALDDASASVDAGVAVSTTTPVVSSVKGQRGASASASRVIEYRSREDVLRLLQGAGWTMNEPIAFDRGAHRLYVFLNSVGFVCACCKRQNGNLSFSNAYARIVTATK